MYNNNNKVPLGPPWLTLKIQLEKALLLKVFFHKKWNDLKLCKLFESPFLPKFAFFGMSLGNEKPYLHINIFACFLLGHALLLLYFALLLRLCHFQRPWNVVVAIINRWKAVDSADFSPIGFISGKPKKGRKKAFTLNTRDFDFSGKDNKVVVVVRKASTQ